MSKTYTLPVKAMAQLISGTTYDKNADRYTMSWTNPIYVEFSELPSALTAVSPANARLHIYIDMNGQDYVSTQAFSLYDKLNIENDVYPGVSKSSVNYGYTQSGGWNTISVIVSTDDLIKGIAFLKKNYDPGIFYSPKSSYQPYIVLTYNEGPLIAYADNPSGYIDRTTPTVFSWHTTWVGFQIEDAAQTSATIQWKDGESGTVHSIPISGSSTSYTMAANTLPESDAILWRVQTVTASGTATSDWRTIRTTDTPAVVTGVSPDGMYIDGAEETRFVWNYQTITGTAQKGYDLQVKGPSDTEYQTIQSETTPNTFAVVPAGTLPGGAIQWRVRGYNQSGIAGEWSAPLQAVVIAAPNAPEVWIDSATCRPTVSWSSVGQLAFQVRIEGTYDSGTVFGTGKTYKIPEYLAPGTYPIGVRILGEYDYWSPWGYASATVENGASGESITLTASAQDGDALLSWTAVENAEKYLVYRQGKLIAETDETQYTDPYAIGSVTYRVRAVFAGSDDYVLSDPASVTLSVRAPRMITPGGTWIDLGLSTEPLPAPTIVAAQAVTLMTYAGVEYPVPEIAPHKTRTYTCSPAFRTAQEAAVLESLLGQVVFLKDQNENSMTGVLTAVQLRPGSMYTVASITVNEIGGVSL